MRPVLLEKQDNDMSRKVNGEAIKCTKCGEVHDRSNYYKNARGNGVNQPCKECYKLKWIERKNGQPREAMYNPKARAWYL